MQGPACGLGQSVRLQPRKPTVSWAASREGCSPEGQRTPGRLDSLHGGSLKGTGEGHSHVLKDKLSGKKASLAKQRVLTGTQEKRRVYVLWKMGRGRLQGYHEVMQGQVRIPKALLEIILSTATKDNEECF